jgi:hypothetical protein
MPKWEKGNWMARDCRHKNITFEELTEKDGRNKDILEKNDQFNLLDSRLRVHFNNEQDTGLDAFGMFTPFKDRFKCFSCYSSSW